MNLTSGFDLCGCLVSCAAECDGVSVVTGNGHHEAPPVDREVGFVAVKTCVGRELVLVAEHGSVGVGI